MFGQVTVFILEHLKENASWRDFIFKANKINFDSFCIYFINFISYSKLTKSILVHFVFILLILFILFFFPAQLFKDREC